MFLYISQPLFIIKGMGSRVQQRRVCLALEDHQKGGRVALRRHEAEMERRAGKAETQETGVPDEVERGGDVEDFPREETCKT